MSDYEKILLGLLQVNNLLSLLKSNEWSEHLSSHLISVKIELERQLSHY
jgi:hypothetical protein